MLFRGFFVIWALAFLLPAMLLGQGTIRLPDVVGSAGVTERRIAIGGDAADLVRTAQQLFRLHGGFEQTDDRPEFSFQFNGAGGSGVTLVISSGGQELFRETYSGDSRLKALYRAADAAVQRTLGLPGWFNSSVAFVSDRTGHSEIYLSDILFQATRQLTRDGSQCLSPNLSPDLGIVLYTSYYRTGFPDIFAVDLRSFRRTTFAGFKGTNTGATFSPNGGQVAMILSGSGNSELYLANAAGRNLRRLTRTSSLEADPTWSPDGRSLALTSDQMGKPQIYTIDATGRNFRRVPTTISRNCSEPSWNPFDPDRLAFTAAMGGEFEVAIYSFKLGKSSVVTRGPGDAVHPVWLRDGRHLIYTERTSRYNRLMILDTVSGRRTVLSPADMRNAREASVAY